jgi:hypothetical protein
MERPTRVRKQPSRLADFELGENSGKLVRGGRGGRGRKVGGVVRGGRGAMASGNGPIRPNALPTTDEIGIFKIVSVFVFYIIIVFLGVLDLNKLTPEEGTQAIEVTHRNSSRGSIPVIVEEANLIPTPDIDDNGHGIKEESEEVGGKSNEEREEGGGKSDEEREEGGGKSDEESEEGGGKSDDESEEGGGKSDDESEEGGGKSDEESEEDEGKSEEESDEDEGKSEEESDEDEGRSDEESEEDEGKSEEESDEESEEESRVNKESEEDVTLDRRSRRRCRSPSGSPGRRRAHNLSATRQSQSRSPRSDLSFGEEIIEPLLSSQQHKRQRLTRRRWKLVYKAGKK